MPDDATWISALRSSHERFAGLVVPLDDEGLRRRSYDPEWSIAQVASHLGSQAEIFGMFLDAGLHGSEQPAQADFGPIWDRWNAMPPAEQARNSVSANEAFVSRLEGLDDERRASFRAALFGTDQNLAGLAAMRLGEHAVHTWDVAVALDPQATVAADAVELLVDILAGTAGHVGRATQQRTVTVATTEPARSFRLTTGPEVSLAADERTSPAELELPAEALVRLVYGRLDRDHTPPGVGPAALLDELREVFPGF